MLDEILDSVKQAEREAQAKVAAAEEKVNASLRDSRSRIDAMWAEGKEQARQRRAFTLAEAEVHAAGQAEHIAAEYAAECAQLRESGMAKVDELVAYLMELVFDGSC